jgi:hypothetical protein
LLAGVGNVADQRAGRLAVRCGERTGVVGDQPVFRFLVPRFAAQKERPEVGIVEVEGERDRLAQVGQRLVGRHLDLPPDLLGVGRGIEAAEDADAEGVNGSFGFEARARHRKLLPPAVIGTVVVSLLQPTVRCIPSERLTSRSPLGTRRETLR